MRNMKNISREEIINLLIPRLHQLGLSKEDIDPNLSLLNQGILDSISFLEFIVEVEANLDVELDFSELDPTEFTSIEGLYKLLINGNSN